MNSFLEELKYHTRILDGYGYLCQHVEWHPNELDAALRSAFGIGGIFGIREMAFPMDSEPSHWSLSHYSITHGLRHMLIAEESGSLRRTPVTRPTQLSDTATIQVVTESLLGASFLCVHLSAIGRPGARTIFEDAMIKCFKCERGDTILEAAFGEPASIPKHWGLKRTSITHGLRMMVLHSIVKGYV